MTTKNKLFRTGITFAAITIEKIEKIQATTGATSRAAVVAAAVHNYFENLYEEKK